MAALKSSRKHRPRRHQPYDFPTWEQIQSFTNQVKNLISQQGMTQSPENLIAMLCWPARPLLKPDLLIYLPNPPLFQVIKWTEKRLSVSTNDSTCMPPPGTLTPWGGGKTNISLGYEVLPLCMGPPKLCINVGWQTWAFILPPKEDF